MSFFRRQSGKKDKEKSTKASTLPKTKPSSLKYGMTGSKTLDNINGTAGITFTDTSIPPKTEHGLILVQDEYCPGDLGVSSGSLDAYTHKSSRLSKCLQDVMKDHEAIPHLIQYMESCKASALIRFWLDADSFQASTWTRIRTHSLNTVSKSSLIKEKSGLKKSKSLNQQDLLSPSSVISEDSAYHETNIHSKSAEALSSSCDSFPLPQNEKTNITDNHSSLGDKEHTANERNKSYPNIEQTGLPENVTESKDSEHSSKQKDGDTRVREKCKSELSIEKTGFSLELSACDSSVNANDAINVQDESESAISYRDLATPSPTETDGKVTSPHSGNKPVISPGNMSISKGALADKLKKSVEQDAVRIFTKYLAMEATHPIGITDDLRNETIRKICREDGQVDPECFMECQKVALNVINEKYYEGFKSSMYHCKYQVEVLTGGKVHLADILYNDTALFYFMEYMEQENLTHLLHFVIATDNFEQLLSSQETYDGLQAQDDAMVLYDKYFSLQAAHPLGFPDSFRFEVEGNICREEGPLPDCFSKPRLIVLHTIEKLHFPRFLTSDVYYRYLSELVSAVQTAQDFPLGQNQRKRRGSESYSEHSAGSQSIGSESVSSKNTLLASGNPRQIQLNKLDENMRTLALDPALLNPDSLWERPEAGKMNLGSIDSLGQFVSQFVPGPEAAPVEKKKSSAGSKFFKSKKDKEKEQEEMARKVAEMILNDVTSVTQAISAIKNDASIQPGPTQHSSQSGREGT